LVTAAVCSSKTCKQLYRGRLWRVGVVDLVVLACVLRATTKKSRQLFCLSQILGLQNRPQKHAANICRIINYSSVARYPISLKCGPWFAVALWAPNASEWSKSTSGQSKMVSDGAQIGHWDIFGHCLVSFESTISGQSPNCSQPAAACTQRYCL